MDKVLISPPIWRKYRDIPNLLALGTNRFGLSENGAYGILTVDVEMKTKKNSST